VASGAGSTLEQTTLAVGGPGTEKRARGGLGTVGHGIFGLRAQGGKGRDAAEDYSYWNAAISMRTAKRAIGGANRPTRKKG